MGNGPLQFCDPNDGRVYFYDKKEQRYKKICDVGPFEHLPPNIQLQIKAAQEEAERILLLPTEEPRKTVLPSDEEMAELLEGYYASERKEV